MGLCSTCGLVAGLVAGDVPVVFFAVFELEHCLSCEAPVPAWKCHADPFQAGSARHGAVPETTDGAADRPV